MDLLMVAREAADTAPTGREIDDPPQAQQLLPKLPHGQQVAPLLARLAVGVMVLSKALDRGASRAAIGVASLPRGCQVEIDAIMYLGSHEEALAPLAASEAVPQKAK